jgi:23S rRNA (cytosine1962-C5)-methyltransferase
MAAAGAGAKEVVHLDASKGINEWAKENMKLSGLEDKTIRFIVDDALKFTAREIRRGRKYDGIIMDPPSYGRGPDNELFRFEDKINPLLDNCMQLLSNEPLFFIVNT